MMPKKCTHKIVCVLMIPTAKKQILTQTQRNWSFLTSFFFIVDIIHFLVSIIIFFVIYSHLIFFILKSFIIYVYTVLIIVNTLKDVLPKNAIYFIFLKSSF